MNDLVARVDKLEELREHLGQHEIMAYMKKSQDENQGRNSVIEEILPDEDQAIINQYEVVCITSGCPINLALDKVGDALLKILYYAENESLDKKG
ncbi:hypothetical protein GQ457_05G023570 [Hibiscus cannabinus]